jgi:hypothetical protein
MVLAGRSREDDADVDAHGVSMIASNAGNGTLVAGCRTA